jgi:hypothetical protein
MPQVASIQQSVLHLKHPGYRADGREFYGDRRALCGTVPGRNMSVFFNSPFTIFINEGICVTCRSVLAVHFPDASLDAMISNSDEIIIPDETPDGDAIILPQWPGEPNGA